MIQDDRLEKKNKVLDYLSHMPFYRWAAKSIGKDEETLRRWREEDLDFGELCEAAKSTAIASLGRRATPDFILKSADTKTFNIATKLEGELNGNLNINLINYGDKPPVPIDNKKEKGIIKTDGKTNT